MTVTVPDETLLYRIALTKVPGIGDITAKNLLRVVGDAQEIFRSTPKSLSLIQGLPRKVVEEIHRPQVMKDAEAELLFVRKNNLQAYFTGDEGYPKRLLDCADSPILLYFKGEADFNKNKVISIVGTRNSTYYGNSVCETLVKELAARFPDLIVVSGLAYGIDIVAHRAALANGLTTIGVLAHGLDRIYPTVHRQTAQEMITQGGLLTEFASKTEPDRFNFVRRNRIVAGMADAVLVIESSRKGGSLITAEIANSYCKDVFALPGRVSDLRSEGCNDLLLQKKADVLISAEQLVLQMNWDQSPVKPPTKAKQQQLFFDLTETQIAILNKLAEEGTMHIDRLSKSLSVSAFDLFPILVELEMKGAVSSLAGSFYEVN